jgi:hypothetical protein
MDRSEIIGLIFFGVVIWIVARVARVLARSFGDALGKSGAADAARNAVATARARASAAQAAATRAPAARSGAASRAIAARALAPPPRAPARQAPRLQQPPPGPRPASDAVSGVGALFRGNALLGSIVVAEALGQPVSLRRPEQR